MTRYAILLSAEEYGSFVPTPFAHADSSLLRDTLVSFCDYAPQHVMCVHLQPGDEHSPQGLLGQVNGTASRLQPGDTMLFFFAGHGHRKDGEAYLILPDSTLESLESNALPLALTQ